MNTQPDNLDVWVLAGQSNMEGVGLLQDALPPDPRVWSFTSAGEWEPATEPLHWLAESYTAANGLLLLPGLADEERKRKLREMAELQRRTRRNGAGLGLPFGVAMAEALGRPVGLIPCAHGATSLAQWSPSGKAEGNRSLYGAMLDRIRRAGGSLTGVLWYQGESDASGDNAATYAERFDRWIAALRSDLTRPDLPVIAVQIARRIQCTPDEESRGWDLVREALRTLPRRTARTAVTSAIDIDLTDTVHLATPGLIRLGRRLARLAIQFETGTDAPLVPQPMRVERSAADRGMGAVHVACRGVTGPWSPAHHIPGFSVTTPAGEPHPVIRVVNVDVDEGDPGALRVLLNLPMPDDGRLGYGLGFDPYCCLVDAADMPMPAFMPMRAER